MNTVNRPCPGRWVVQSEVPLADDDVFFIITGLRFADGFVFTNHMPEPFEKFVQHHPPIRAEPRGAPSRPKVSATDDARERLKRDYPWIRDEDFSRLFPRNALVQVPGPM